MPGAWVSPEGLITQFGNMYAHSVMIEELAGLSPNKAIQQGWVFLRSGTEPGIHLDMKGQLDALEKQKTNILEWAGWPKIITLDIQLSKDHVVYMTTTADELLDKSVYDIFRRKRILEFAHRRLDRAVHVREHKRRA